MRKHFLILMLLTLLPFAGWAADGDITAPSAKDNLVYDGTAQALINAGAVEGTTYEMRYYVTTDATVTTPDISAFTFSNTNLPTGTNAGDYYVFYVAYNTATSTHSAIGAKISCGIEKKTIDSGTDFTVPAGFPDPNAEGSLTFDGTAQQLIKTPLAWKKDGDNNPIIRGTVYYKLGEEGNWTTTASTVTATNANTTGYTVYYKIEGDDNHKDLETAGMKIVTKIAPKTLANVAANYTITVSNNSKRYNGKVQKATITITDLGIGTDGTLLNQGEDGDYVVTYTDGNANVEDPKDADTYSITITGKNNYASAAFDLTDQLEIDKVNLTIKVNDVTKVYDGRVYDPTAQGNAFTFTYTGLKNGEVAWDGTNGVLSQAPVVTATTYNTKKNVGQYPDLTATYTGVAPTNYNVVISTTNGNLSITQRPLTITLPTDYRDATKKVYGANDPTFDGTWNTANIELENVAKYDSNNDNDYIDENEFDETAHILSELLVARTNAGTDENVGKKAGVLTVGYKTTEGDNPHPYLNNYSFDFAAVTGNFEITKADLEIQLNDTNVEYTSAQAVIGNVTVNDLTIEGWKNGDAARAAELIDMSKLTFTVENNAINAGYYDVDVDASALTLDNYNVTAYSGQIHVVPAVLTATIPTQTVKVGAAAAAFDATKWEVEGIKVNDDKAALQGVLTYSPDFTDPNTQTGTYNQGIILAIGNQNYTLEGADANGKVYGILRILSANSINLDQENTNLATDIQTVNGQVADVTFGDRILTREVWTAMVLPFETTVTEVSAALGYAVVDVLDDTENSNDMHLKLHMGKINANQPFIVKYYKEDVLEELYTETTANEYNATLGGAVHAGEEMTSAIPASYYADKDEYNAAHPGAEVDDAGWAALTEDQKIKTPAVPATYYSQADADAHNANLPGAKHAGNVKVAAVDYSTLNLSNLAAGAFASKTIVYDPTDATYVNADGNVFVQNANNGHQFIGVYNPVDVAGAEYKWIRRLDGALVDGAKYKEQGTTANMRRLIAYFKLNTANGNARILIDEPDGTTTVINAVTAESMNVQADGWYTLNGVKLQSIPTQKGIYINNGKKVVIK